VHVHTYVCVCVCRAIGLTEGESEGLRRRITEFSSVAKLALTSFATGLVNKLPSRDSLLPILSAQMCRGNFCPRAPSASWTTPTRVLARKSPALIGERVLRFSWRLGWNWREVRVHPRVDQ